MPEKIQKIMYEKRFCAYGGAPTGFTVFAGQGGVDSFVIMDRADFFVNMIIYRATSDKMLLNIRIGGRNLFDKALDINLVASNIANQVYSIPLPVIMRFEHKTSIQLDYTDYSGSDNVVFMGFRGYELVKV